MFGFVVMVLGIFIPAQTEKFSWFDYRSKGFNAQRVWRIDSYFSHPRFYTKQLFRGWCWLPNSEQNFEKPSDHAPICGRLPDQKNKLAYCHYFSDIQSVAPYLLVHCRFFLLLKSWAFEQLVRQTIATFLVFGKCGMVFLLWLLTYSRFSTSPFFLWLSALPLPIGL